MHIEVVDSIEKVPAERWDQLAGSENPFLRHAFLHGLEVTGCVGPGTGWQPSHLLLRDEQQRLLAAAPAYLKSNSRGEFVFDFSWADAYQRAGGAYYPKLVIAVPFTPATGPRVLHDTTMTRAEAARTIADGMRAICQQQGLSSAHCLFAEEPEALEQADQGLLLRLGCQFHWSNANYPDFDSFLAGFSSKKRKNVRRERRLARQDGATFDMVPGHRVTEADWHHFVRFFTDTFHLYGNRPPLNAAFFRHLAETMGEQVLMAQARDADGLLLAAALLFRSKTTLYGRYWGCREERPGVHFETCFYQGIEYCIRQGLQRFEPGAQGEHKIARGFLPTATYSCHWLQDAGFRSAVADFLERETPMVHQYMQDLNGHMPYREPPTTAFDRPDQALS